MPLKRSKEIKTSEVNPPNDRGNASGLSTDHVAKAYQQAGETLPSENRDTTEKAQASNFKAFLQRAGCWCFTKEQVQDIHEEVELGTRQEQLEIARRKAEQKVSTVNIVESHERGLRTTGDKAEQDKNIKAAEERRKRAENVKTNTGSTKPRRSSRLSESFTPGDE